jgi:hypothetical protein
MKLRDLTDAYRVAWMLLSLQQKRQTLNALDSVCPQAAEVLSAGDCHYCGKTVHDGRRLRRGHQMQIVHKCCFDRQRF